MQLDREIVRAVAQQQRRLQRGVFPWMVQAWIDMPRSEATLRNRMRQLWLEGKLERIGGAKARRGYRVPASVIRSVA